MLHRRGLRLPSFKVMHPCTQAPGFLAGKRVASIASIARLQGPRGRADQRGALPLHQLLHSIHGQGRCGKGQRERSPIHAFYHDDLVVPDYLVTVKVPLSLETS